MGDLRFRGCLQVDPSHLQVTLRAAGGKIWCDPLLRARLSVSFGFGVRCCVVVGGRLLPAPPWGKPGEIAPRSLCGHTPTRYAYRLAERRPELTPALDTRLGIPGGSTLIDVVARFANPTALRKLAN